MIKAEVGNLLESIDKYKLDGITNAANGKGPMGRGIAGAIRRAGGDEIQRDAFKVCSIEDPQPGDSYSTISGSLKEKGIKRIIHAVTMKQPGGITSLSIIEKAFKSALKLADFENIKMLGCTALGTGVGGLDSVKVAQIMANAALENKSDIDIIFVDFDSKFIEEVQKNIQ